MKCIKYMWMVIKKIFYKENKIKMIEKPIETVKSPTKSEFKSSLKIKLDTKKKKVETLTCVGDGLGIQNSVSY